MLMPSIFTNTYFNDFFEDPFKGLDYKHLWSDDHRCEGYQGWL